METRSTSSQMIGTVLSGRYRLKAKLGSGGMSTVYLAHDETLDRPVAAKVMHREMSEQADQLERFRREARAVAKLSHPNVVAVIDAGEDGGHPYIVFEYVEGENLKQRINRLGPLDAQEALAYAIEVGRGLSVAHARKLVHRDIKPQNVLIDAEGRAKVTDFGIARQLEQTGSDRHRPRPRHHRLCLPRAGDGPGRRPALRHLLARSGPLRDAHRRGPFSADTQVGVAMKHVNEELPDVQRRRTELSAAAALTIERATTKDPAKRYGSIAEMIDDLETALEVEAARAGSTEGEATTILKAVRPKRRLLGRTAGARWPAGSACSCWPLGPSAAVIMISDGGGGGGGGVKSTPIEIEAAEDFDPLGGDGEHPEEVGAAIDGDPTATGGTWSTESYTLGPALADSGKEGVGI